MEQPGQKEHWFLNKVQPLIVHYLCQAIVQAVGIPRADAMESLKHADSDISAAFQNELARMQLNRHRLREMVLEYAGYR